MTGWLDTIAGYNPVTFLLDGLRALVTEGWVSEDLLQGVLAVAGVGAVSMTLALLVRRGRVRRS